MDASHVTTSPARGVAGAELMPVTVSHSSACDPSRTPSDPASGAPSGRPLAGTATTVHARSVARTLQAV